MSVNLHNKKNLKIIGLMSGTSCDGLDIALIEIQTAAPLSQFKFIAGKTIDYSPAQRDGILKLIQSDAVTLQSVSQINFYLAQIWAEMIDAFLNHNNLSSREIDLIASHGQTLWHQPDPQHFIDRPVSSTLQLGDPAVLAQLTGIPVIGDFRVADVALGGQGAPLIPYFDWIYFSQFKQNILAVNIGGISNFTFIPSNGAFEGVSAFDCGPGNMLIDQAMQILFDEKFDRDGLVAGRGAFSNELFDFIKETDSFLRKKPPKSTGREHYNQTFLKMVLKTGKTLKLNPADIVCTLTEYTAFGIHSNYAAFLANNRSLDSIVLGGGGASNPYLVGRIKNLFNGIPVKQTHEYGLNEAYKEAIGFAILAHETLLGKSSNVPQVTRAKRPAILGKLCPV